MSDSNPVTAPLTNTPTALPNFGDELAKARKKKVLSLDDVANELNILKRHIEAIERQDYQALPPKAYAQGFVKSYARLVGLNEEEMARQFEMGYPKAAEEIVPVQTVGSTIRRGRTSIRLNLPLVAAIIAVIIFGLMILKMVSGAKNNQTNELSQTQVVDSLSSREQAQGAAIGNTGSALGTTGSVVGAEVITNGIIDFWVKEPTTIVVKDGKGAILMDGTQNRGGYQITGQSPFSIEIIDPDKVDVSFNHQKVELANYRQGNKAVLTLQ